MTIINLTPPTEGKIDLTPLAATEVLLAPVGPAGPNGWSPRLTLVTDGARRVFQVSDWIGGTGAKPATGLYVGSSGLVSLIGSAVDVRGPQGAAGSTGATGSGWAPVPSVETDGVRRVIRIVDWVGGTGTKPTTGQYLGPTGLVTPIASAVDVRGGTGATGNKGWSPVFALVADGERRVLQIASWTGGEGSAPAAGDFLGSSGLVSTAGAAADIRGAIGPNGWSPMLAVVNDGSRRVLQVADWTGGVGTKPATGSYLGASGFVTPIASAVDVRGPIGVSIPTGGSAGQYLQKQSSADYDFQWVTLTLNNDILNALQWQRFAR